jgi:two-component system sensor histidine kinase YesM
MQEEYAMATTQSHKSKPNSSFFKNIQNSHFKKIFLKNWLTVFISIVLPIIICVLSLHWQSRQSLLNEIDEGARRSTLNTAATLEALFQEASSTLDNALPDQTTLRFFSTQASFPTPYSFVSLIDDIRDRVNADLHSRLYYSVDFYSAASDFLVSSRHQGQFYRWVDETSICNAYLQYQQQHPEQLHFAVSRATTDPATPRVLTIYRTHPITSYQNSFVSISINQEQLVSFIIDASNSKNSTFLLTDEDGQVLFDTSGELIDTQFAVDMDNSSFTCTVNGQLVRVFWTNLDMFNWRCIQTIPLVEYQRSTVRLRHLTYIIIALATVVSTLVSYGVTLKLFHPVEAILNVVENPSDCQDVNTRDEELQFILLQILELFQKNITLENEMLDRVVSLRRLRANALQKQMSPHFLNNVLNVINWTAIEETGNENCVTSQQLVLLADIIRTMKEQTGNLSTVASEIDYTKKFMQLEELRYGTQIICTYEIDDSILNTPIPAISLQTLVENAITHGLQPKGSVGNICIRIAPNAMHGLHISVEDDGVGMSQSAIDSIFASLQQEFVCAHEHLGLINLFQRFRLIYGDECVFHISNGSDGGLCVQIDTPEVIPEFLSQIDHVR